MKPRTLILALALLGSIGWSAWILITPQDEVVLATNPAARSQIGVRRSAQLQTRLSAPTAHDVMSAPSLSWSVRPQAPAKPHNVFSAYTYEAPRPAPVAAAPVPPRAPSLPFAYSGRLVIDGRATYLLLQSGTPISVTVGADIGDFKLVEAEADRLVFLHGPTGQQVAMSLASKPVN